jgi:muramoyltetrapeptide carboxypeptidase
MASLSASTPDQEEALVSLAQTLQGKPALLEVAAHPFNKHGTAKGMVIGGNLSILYSLLESPESFQPAGKILFLEEVDEYLYHLDRMLSTFRRAGKLQGLAGLVIGTMTNMKDNEVPFGLTAEEMLYDHLSNLPVPVAFGFPAGHIAANQSFYLGMQAQLRVDEAGAKLSYEGDL